MSREIRKSDLSAKFVLRMSPTVLERVELAAASERRNPSQFLRILIEDALEARSDQQAA